MLKIDLHVHTLASGHAYNTILEYINQAVENKMKVIGISDHGSSLYGCLTNDFYFSTLRRMPKTVKGVRVLKGIEANIKNDGTLDASDRVLETLDYVMAGFHIDSGYKDAGKDGNTEAALKVIESGKINIFTHPFVIKGIDFDQEKVYEAACKNNVLLELNASYLTEHRVTEEMVENLKIMIKIAKKNNKRIIVNSDAHFVWELGNDDSLKKLKDKVKIDKEMIINNYPKELFKILGIKE